MRSLALGFCFKHRLTGGGGFRERDALRERGFKNGDVGIVRERGGDIAAYRRICDFTINRKYGFQALLDDAHVGDDFHYLTRRPDVVRRRLHRDDHDVAGGDRGFGDGVDAGWAVDYDPVVGGGEGRHFTVERVLGKTDDGEEECPLAGGGPVEGAALGIGVDEEDLAAIEGHGGGDIGRQGGLTDPAFLVEEGHDWHRLRLLLIYDDTILR